MKNIIFIFIFLLSSCSDYISEKELDYSNPGQPEEVALSPEEYLPGDQLYDPGHPNYYDMGKRYLTAENEIAIRDLWTNHEGKVVIQKYYPKFLEYDDVEDLFYIHSETKRKEYTYADVGNMLGFLRNPLIINDSPEKNPLYSNATEQEYDLAKDFMSKFSQTVGNYTGWNKADSIDNKIDNNIYLEYIKTKKEGIE